MTTRRACRVLAHARAAPSRAEMRRDETVKLIPGPPYEFAAARVLRNAREKSAQKHGREMGEGGGKERRDYVARKQKIGRRISPVSSRRLD